LNFHEPVFIDIDPDSYNINLDKLENYLEDNHSKKLKAVIITHIAGACVDLDIPNSSSSSVGFSQRFCTVSFVVVMIDPL